uniref:Uncharacterized protein n=1 Tax=Romanomermis culicivorax TaxID=13658 RepID=A0A915KUK0_ROMCU
MVIAAIIKLGRTKIEFRSSYHQLLINLLSSDAAYFAMFLIGSLPNISSYTCQKVFNEIGSHLLGFGKLVDLKSLGVYYL